MHAFFDLDGTLTDPKEGIMACIKYVLSKLEQPIPAMDVLEKCIGPPLHEVRAQMPPGSMRDFEDWLAKATSNCGSIRQSN